MPIVYETHLWIYWLSIAADHEAAARAVRQESRDRPIGGATVQLVDAELEHSIVAVSGAAHAIDAFYGATAQMIRVSATERATWDANRTPRAGRILETLKRGFDIGTHHRQWSADLKWLFSLRDAAVHPTVKSQPMARHASGISMPRVDPDFPGAASRALQLSTTILRTCLDAPRSTEPALVAWCDDDKRNAVNQALRVRDVVRPEAFLSGRALPPR